MEIAARGSDAKFEQERAFETAKEFLRSSSTPFLLLVIESAR
jgi:hypothetical protein